MTALRTIVLVSLVAVGCNKDDGGGSGAASSAAPKPAASGATTGAVVPASDAKPVLGAGRTNVPTLDEWNTQRKEVTVKGSTALSCETKMVREYLRVSCHGKNDSGGTPTTVRVTKGGRGEVLTFANPGVTSLIMPFVEGADVEAEFSWTNKSHKLVVRWPKGVTKQPVVVGTFEGAKSPLDGTADGDSRKLCECHKKVTGQATCEDMMGGADPDCDRTYGNDCGMLLACARGEPSAFPKCLPGFAHFGAIGRCGKICGPGKEACPAGRVCSSDMGPTPVCVEP